MRSPPRRCRVRLTGLSPHRRLWVLPIRRRRRRAARHRLQSPLHRKWTTSRRGQLPFPQPWRASRNAPRQTSLGARSASPLMAPTPRGGRWPRKRKPRRRPPRDARNSDAEPARSLASPASNAPRWQLSSNYTGAAAGTYPSPPAVQPIPKPKVPRSGAAMRTKGRRIVVGPAPLPAQMADRTTYFPELTISDFHRRRPDCASARRASGQALLE
jgi:hypothetical protein